MSWLRYVKQLGRATAASSVAGTDKVMVLQGTADKVATISQTRASPTFTGTVTLPSTVAIGTLQNAANDAAAASASVPVGSLYRNGSILMQRIV